MSLVISQPMSSLASDEWSSGICDCFDDVPDCCLGFWCFPCYMCITTKNYGECLCLPLLEVFGLIPPITMSIRASMRERYRIKGTICHDCVCATFCRGCVWCQMSREMKSRTIPIVLGDIICR